MATVPVCDRCRHTKVGEEGRTIEMPSAAAARFLQGSDVLAGQESSPRKDRLLVSTDSARLPR